MNEQTYEIALSPTARRNMTKLAGRVATAAVEFLFGPVADNPHRTGAPLKLGLEGLYGARRGDHRIIYAIDDEARVAQVVTIGHRSEVFRRRTPQ